MTSESTSNPQVSNLPRESMQNSSSNNLIDSSTFLTGVTQPNNAGNNTYFQTTPSHIGSESIHSANTNTTTESNSITNQAKVMLTNSIIILQDCEAKSGWKNYLIFLFVNVYWMWCLMFVPTVGNYNWGNIGQYILIDGFSFPITMVAELIPYESIVVIASFFIGILLTMFVVFTISIRLMNKQNKYFKKLKGITFYSALITKPFSLLFVYVLVGFLNCNATLIRNEGESSETSASLMRYPNQACLDETTSLIMLILSIVSMVILLFFVFPLSEFVTSNSNPNSTIPMLAENPFVLAIVGSLSLIQLIITQVLPTDFIFISAIVHLVCSILCCLVVFYSLPYMKKIENSLYFGVMCGRVGASIGSLVSSLVNSNDNVQQFDMMGLAFTFVTIALIALFFIIGTLVMEFYQRIQLKRARDMFKNCIQGHEVGPYGTTSPMALIEKNAMNLYFMFEDSNKMSLLNLFVKSCLLSNISTAHGENKKSKNENQELNDCDMAMSFIRGSAHQKAFKNIELLIYSSLLIQTQMTDSNNSVLSMSLLKRASFQHPNIYQQLKIREKMKQIESFHLKSTSNSFEMTSQLETLEKNQQNLFVLHRNFWKEMASERINYTSIEKINRSIYALTSECRITLQNLIFNNKNNKTLLRLYGNFLENFEFNTELSQYYYNEATSIEEEEMKKRRKNSIISNTGSNKRGNRVVPLVKNNYETAMPSFAEEQPNEDELESAFENPKIKREQVFKSAISSQRSNTLSLTITFIYMLACLSLFAASFGLSLYYSENVKSGIPYLQQVCQPSISPYSVIRNLRATQNFITTFLFFEFPWPKTYLGFKALKRDEYILNSISRLRDSIEIYSDLIRLGQSNSFDSIVYSDYSANVYPTNYPGENPNDVKLYDLGRATQKNISILEFTNNMIKYTQNLIDDFPIDLLLNITTNNHDPSHNDVLLNLAARETFFHPLRNYNLMFLLANRETASNAFDRFCSRYLDRATNSISNSTQQLIYYTISVLIVFIMISVAYLSYMIYEMSQLRNIVKMYEKQLSKDVIGKIYHTLNNKTTDTVNNRNTTLSLARLKPNRTIVLLIILVAAFTCASIVMFYYESDLNASTAARVMNNVRLSIQAAASIQRISFNTGEVLTYFVSSEISNNVSPLAVNYKRNVTYGDPRLFNTISNLNAFFDRATNRLPNLSDMWSRLIYGDINAGTSPILGMYPDVDSLINQGVSSNCTEYLQKNNITLTLESNMLYCIGLESLLNDYMTLIPQLLTDSRQHHTLQKSATLQGILLPKTDIGLRHNQAMRMAVALSNKFTTFIKEFIVSSSAPSFGVAIGITCLELIICTIFFTMMYTIYMNYCGHLHSLRLMSQYVPVEVLERNEILRNFILYNSTSTLTKMKDELKKCIQYIFKKNGKDSDKNKNSEEFTDLNENTSSQEGNRTCEVIELDCIRRNQTKFPCKITLFSVKIQGERGSIRNILILTLKDLTSEKKQNALLSEEKQKSDNLLKNILPTSVASRLKSGQTFIAEKLDDITCFFSDMVGFTAISSNMQATDLVMMLNSIVNGFDLLTEKYDLEKIKTIGDAYFAVGGLPGAATSDHPERVLKFAIETFGVINEFNSNSQKSQEENTDETVLNDSTKNSTIMEKQKINIRVGINTGPVVAGVIGMKKFAYDLWGDTINTASRMESTSKNGRIQISRSTYERVFDLGYEFEEREVDVKGKGIVKTYLLNDKHHRYLKNNPLLYTNNRSMPMLFNQ